MGDDLLPVFLSGFVVGNIVISTLLRVLHGKSSESPVQENIEYRGTCHCEKVQFTVRGPRHLVVWKCNCTICDMKKNWHFVVPKENVTLHCDQSALQEYTFGTHTAKHLFCKTCGVQAFYVYKYRVYITVNKNFVESSFESRWLGYHTGMC